jgi:hypothetical protein
MIVQRDKAGDLEKQVHYLLNISVLFKNTERYDEAQRMYC